MLYGAFDIVEGWSTQAWEEDDDDFISDTILDVQIHPALSNFSIIT